MKKVLALILAFSTLFTVVGFSSVTAEEESEYNFYLEFVEKLGIVDEGGFADSAIARQDLAIYMNNIFSGAKRETLTSDDFFVDSNKDTLYIPSTEVGVFDDVYETDAGYSAIQKLNELGIMNGTGYRTFSPETNVTYAQLATVIVRTLGYEYKVENKNYVKVAEAIGAFDDIAYDAASAITLLDFAKVLYNCLDINVIYADMKGDHIIFKEKEDVDMFNEFMDVYECEGMLEENPFTKVNGRKTGSKDRIVVDGAEFIAPDNGELYSLIGRDVNLFYRKTKKDDMGTVLWGYATGKDEAMTFTAEQIVSFEDFKLTYEENDRYKDEDLAASSVLIKNGIYQPSFTDADLVFENGDLTIIKPRNASDYSIIVLNDYKSLMVTSVNNASGLLNGREYHKGALSDYSLSNDKYDEWRIRYYFEDGTPATFKDISKGMVIDVLRNEETPLSYTKIILSNNTVENARITSMSGVTEDGIEYSFEDGTSLTMPKDVYDYLAADGAEPKLGGTYTFSINSFGKVIYVEAGTEKGGLSFVYVIERRYDEFTDDFVLRYLNQSGKIITSYFKKGALLINERGQEHRLDNATDAKELITLEGAPYTGIAQITLNEGGLITKMVMPVTDVDKNRKNTLGAMVDGLATGAATKYWTGPENPHFDGVMKDGSTVSFKIDPTETEEEKRYSVFTDYSVLRNDMEYKISAYNFDNESVLAKCLVIELGSNSSAYLHYTSPLYIVTETYEGVNEDKPCQMVTMTSFGYSTASTSATYPVDEGVNIGSFARPDATDITLKKGDICYARIENSVIKEMKVIYRIDVAAGEPNLFDSSGKFNPDPGNGKYAAGQVNQKVTNPFGINETGMTLENGNSVDLGLGTIRLRFLAGDVYSMEDNKYLTFTTQNIKGGETYNPDAAEHKCETMSLPSKFTVITIEGRNISIKAGTANDIYTYKDSGRACSKIFMSNNYAAMRRMAIINIVE